MKKRSQRSGGCSRRKTRSIAFTTSISPTPQGSSTRVWRRRSTSGEIPAKSLRYFELDRVGIRRIVGQRLDHQEFGVHREPDRVRLSRFEQHGLILDQQKLVFCAGL